MTKQGNTAITHRALRAFQVAVRSARLQHAKERRPFYILKNGRVVDYFHPNRSLPKRKAA